MHWYSGLQSGRWCAAVFAAPLCAVLTACATSPTDIVRPTDAQLAYRSADASFGGFDLREAQDAVEFCVELDNQDDRLKARQALNAASPPDPSEATRISARLDRALPRIDAKRWDPKPLFDSREQVAKAYFEFKALPALPEDEIRRLPDSDPRHWFRLFADLEKRAKDKKIERLDVQTIRHDPDLNGFGPWQNAWLLYRGVGDYAGRYAVVIRGTVFSNLPSAFDDVYFQPVIAHPFLSEKFSFSDASTAAVHSGFAHATFSALLDLRFGIIPALVNLPVPSGAKLYVVGHSQGAGIATLVHAALHYGMRAGDLDGDDALGLKGKHYLLKSYEFAQPKPGDFAFATSFARITQSSDNAIVINNDLDPVVQVPLTLGSTADLAADFNGGSTLSHFVRWVSSLGKSARSGFGAVVEPITRKQSAGYSYFFHYDKLLPLTDKDTVGSSWNFMNAGRVIWVYGTRPPPGSDDFYQHHATTYRELLKQLAPM